MGDISQVLNLLAFLSLGLLSVTIPTYAISVVFLGRETRRTILDRESRQRDLAERLRRLTKSVESGPGLDALKKEIAQYEDDVKWLTGRSATLSVKGAFLYPFSLFLLAFILSAFGLTIAEYAFFFGIAAVGSLILGTTMLIGTLFMINEAATSPETLTAFRVSFESGSTAQRFARSTVSDVSIGVHNYGKQMAEEVMVHVNFPPAFVLVPGNGYRLFRQTPPSGIPGFTTAIIQVGSIHEDIMLSLPTLKLTTPSQPSRYVVLVTVWEKRLGKSGHQLALDVA